MDQNNWNISEKERKGILKTAEKAILIGVITPQQGEDRVNEYLDELDFLALTAGAYAIKRFVQKLSHPDRRTFVGSGKLKEIKTYVEANDINLAIFDDDLAAMQQHNIEKELKIKVVDRSSLILDIFASRAKTAQAKTQVELAQLQYLLPRLRGMWTHLERQRGGIGMRGPGEKEIETDRRIVRDQISLLKKKLDKIDLQSQTQRGKRGQLVRISLVGYTNVGKSTIMNLLAKSDVFAENKLFATLDTTVRKVVFENTPCLLSDTVGFIRKLPHHLIESFKSTLDEVRESDILVHVVDIAHSQYEDHIDAVNRTLKDLDAIDKKTLMIFNKMDLYREKYFDELLDGETKEDIEAQLKDNLRSRYGADVIFISASKKENLSELRILLKKWVEEVYEIRYPYQVRKWV
jgi:GTP-binding protein HflX